MMDHHAELCCPRERPQWRPIAGFLSFNDAQPHYSRKRTRVARLFPNEAACLRLVSAILMEISEDWQTADKRYVVFDDENAITG